jgi:hypothetical protein
MDDLIGKIFEIVIFSVIYFSVTYSLLEFVFKKTETKDERDDMINSKSYKLGYLLYEFSLFIFIGTLSSNRISSHFKNQELLNLTDVEIIFLILILLTFISFVKSSYQLYLHRTF